MQRRLQLRSQRRDMEDTKKQKAGGRPERDASEIGVVRVFSRPGPDAEDRVRRLFSLLVRYATSDGQAEPRKDSLTGARSADDQVEAET